MPSKKLNPTNSQEITPQCVTNPTADDIVPSDPSPTQRRSPCLFLAEQLVSALLASAPEIREAACLPGAIVIGHVPSGWGDAVLAAWLDVVHGVRAYPDDGPDDDFELLQRRAHRAGPIAIVARDQTGVGRSPPKPVSDEQFSTALSSGRGLFVVVDSEEALPSLLIAAADLELTFPPPSGAMLAAVAAQVAIGECEPIPDALASVVRPIDIPSARRPGQTALDFMGRLQRILSRKEAPPHRALTVKSNIEWTLDTLPLSLEVGNWARQVSSDLKAFAVGELEWKDVEHGALLAGPPGCGKTTLAHAIANTCGVPLFVTSYSILESGPDGTGRYTDLLRNMRATFSNARANAPCVLLFDEIDSVLGRGMAGHNESWFAPITNALTTETAAEAREGVLFLGATNFPDRVDPALRRSGRLDRLVVLAPPDFDQVGRLLGAHLPSLADADCANVAAALVGHTGADVARLARGARRRARKAGRDIVVGDLVAELDDGMPIRRADHQRRIAIYKAGQALVTELRRPGEVSFISMRVLASDTTIVGHASALLPETASTLPALEGYLMELLAGRAAEMLILGDASAGGAGNLQRATALCVAIELSVGLGEMLSGIGVLDRDDVARTLLMCKFARNTDPLRGGFRVQT